MDFIQARLLNKIDNLVKMSSEFDTGFKIIYDSTNQLSEKEIEILYSMTKNYILMRKEHGEILLMMNKFTNSIQLYNVESQTGGAKSSKNVSKSGAILPSAILPSVESTTVTDETNAKSLYDLSTFNTLLGNVNDLINNVDYEYKKIAIKYPKFINKNQMSVILISENLEDKYSKLMDEIKSTHPEHKYKIIICGDEQNGQDKITKCEEELKEYGIKIKPKTLPIIYIINGSTFTSIPISKIDVMDSIKNMID